MCAAMNRGALIVFQLRCLNAAEAAGADRDVGAGHSLVEQKLHVRKFYGFAAALKAFM